jgi:hypothetical protein
MRTPDNVPFKSERYYNTLLNPAITLYFFLYFILLQRIWRPQGYCELTQEHGKINQLAKYGLKREQESEGAQGLT